jgi:hypothetical protein
MGMRKMYPSDMSREQFELIRELLARGRQKTRPRTIDLYDVLRHSLPVEEWLSVATVTERFSETAHGV